MPLREIRCNIGVLILVLSEAIVSVRYGVQRGKGLQSPKNHYDRSGKKKDIFYQGSGFGKDEAVNTAENSPVSLQ